MHRIKLVDFIITKLHNEKSNTDYFQILMLHANQLTCSHTTVKELKNMLSLHTLSKFVHTLSKFLYTLKLSYTTGYPTSLLSYTLMLMISVSYWCAVRK